MNDNTADGGDGLFRLLFLGDVVGEPGRKAVAVLLPLLKEELKIDFTVVNGENAAGGFFQHSHLQRAFGGQHTCNPVISSRGLI